jgi:hypothetical protein
MKPLQRIINDIQTEIVNAGLKYSINRGGCGVFAYYLSLALTKHNIPHEIRATSWDDDWEDSKLEKTKAILAGEMEGVKYLPQGEGINWRKSRRNTYTGHSCSHCMVYISELEHCVDGKEYESESWGGYKYTLEELRLAVSTPAGWNNAFKHSHIPLVRQIINRNFLAYAG